MNVQSIEEAVKTVMHTVFANSQLHARRVESLTHAVMGAVFAAQAGVASIGRAEAAVRCTNPKHAVKQVDRFLSNIGFDVEIAMQDIIHFVLGNRWKVIVSLDWTDYEGGKHHRIALNLITKHGRATPLLWKTVPANQIKNHRNDYEDELLRLFKRLLPEKIKQVIVLADRGFADIELYDMLTGELGFDFIVRFRSGMTVRNMHGEKRYGSQWVPSNGRALLLPNAKITGKKFDVRGVVAVKRAKMKEAWLLATSLSLSAEQIVALYARRFTIEENFRDEKDWRFGMGSRKVSIKRSDRRDKLCLILALATIILTLIGHAGEQLGLDRTLRANTVKQRTHSLFRQGREYIRGAVGKFENAVAKILACLRFFTPNQLLWTEDLGII